MQLFFSLTRVQCAKGFCLCLPILASSKQTASASLTAINRILSSVHSVTNNLKCIIDYLLFQDFCPREARQRFNRTISQDFSVSTSDISLLISNRSTYSALTEKRTKESQKSVKEKRIIDEEKSDMSSLTYVPEIEHDDGEVSELVKEASIQFQIMQQTAKAVSVCRSIKEFEASPELLEAERILLTASKYFVLN